MNRKMEKMKTKRTVRKAHYRKTVETKGHQDRSEERVGGGGRDGEAERKEGMVVRKTP